MKTTLVAFLFTVVGFAVGQNVTAHQLGMVQWAAKRLATESFYYGCIIGAKDTPNAEHCGSETQEYTETLDEIIQ